MVREVPDLGQLFADLRKKIDSRKRRLLMNIIGAEGSRSPSTFFDAFFEIGHQGQSDSFPLLADPHHQGMQFPHMIVILADATDPAKDRAVLGAGGSGSLRHNYAFASATILTEQICISG